MVVTPWTGWTVDLQLVIGFTANATFGCSGSARQPGRVSP